MTYIMKDKKKISSNKASDILYDNTNSDLSSENVNDVIDELNSNISVLSNRYTTLLETLGATVKTQSGSFSTGTCLNLSSYSKTIVFNEAFNVVPTITISSSNQDISVGTSNITKSGFTATWFKNSADRENTATITWIAEAPL